MTAIGHGSVKHVCFEIAKPSQEFQACETSRKKWFDHSFTKRVTGSLVAGALDAIAGKRNDNARAFANLEPASSPSSLLRPSTASE
jgi:hypothetical protein